MGAGLEDDDQHRPPTTDDMIAATNGESVTYEYATTGSNSTQVDPEVTKNVTTEAESFKIEFEANVEEEEDVGPAASPTSGPGLRRQVTGDDDRATSIVLQHDGGDRSGGRRG